MDTDITSPDIEITEPESAAKNNPPVTPMNSNEGPSRTKHSAVDKKRRDYSGGIDSLGGGRLP
jgi:hypothetical protein